MKFGSAWAGPGIASEAEDAGISAFCTGDFADHDAYLNLFEMAHGVRTTEVGTAIAYAFARTPYAHATAARQIYRAAPAGMFLGFGSGAARINRDWFSVPADRPVARIKELVGAVRTFLQAENGDVIRYKGDFYDIDATIRAPVLGRLEIPLLLAAFNSGMAQAAGEVGDGLIGHGLFTTRWWNDIVRPAAERGRRTAAYDGTTWRETGWLITAVDDENPDRALLDARRMIAFYLTVRTYDPFVEFHGWTREVEAIREAFAAHDVDAMTDAVTDEMVQAVAVAGTTRQAQAMLAERTDGLPADTVFLAPPSYLVSARRRQAYARASWKLVENGPVALR